MITKCRHGSGDENGKFLTGRPAGSAQIPGRLVDYKMGKIFYIMGKSASGKDSIYKELIGDPSLGLRGVVMYSTRPMRAGETDGKDYFFISPERLAELDAEGRIIEKRTYDTVFGPWTYATVDDGQIDLSLGDYLMVGVLESYLRMRDYYGADALVPLYVEVEDGERLMRAIRREMNGVPKYAEMCRRFLTDSEDFSDEKLAAAGIVRRYDNLELKACISEIRETIFRCRAEG